MQAIVDFWTSLGIAGQGALLGLVTSAIVAAAQKLSPGLTIVPNRVKRGVIAGMAGLSAYVATGDVGAAVAAALAAFGAYQLATGSRD